MFSLTFTPTMWCCDLADLSEILTRNVDRILLSWQSAPRSLVIACNHIFANFLVGICHREADNIILTTFLLPLFYLPLQQLINTTVVLSTHLHDDRVQAAEGLQSEPPASASTTDKFLTRMRWIIDKYPHCKRAKMYKKWSCGNF